MVLTVMDRCLDVRKFLVKHPVYPPTISEVVRQVVILRLYTLLKIWK